MLGYVSDISDIDKMKRGDAAITIFPVHSALASSYGPLVEPPKHLFVFTYWTPLAIVAVSEKSSHWHCSGGVFRYIIGKILSRCFLNGRLV